MLTTVKKVAKQQMFHAATRGEYVEDSLKTAHALLGFLLDRSVGKEVDEASLPPAAQEVIRISMDAKLEPKHLLNTVAIVLAWASNAVDTSVPDEDN